ncbi:DUF72 domain-containing protein [candidate division NPL-UPA2 bacterium]|nr:DUF72 domain-containing protein [candidate division NPL-UPA2 bacterium]
MIYIGTSGYAYKHWGGGVFYPEKLSQKNWLEFYAQHFKSVELNVTFYRLPVKSAFQGWQRRTHPDFSFAVKGSRFITHIKRLQDIEDSLKILFARAKSLEKKFSVVLWQLPPKFKVNVERLKTFLKCLGKYKYTRHAFEFRNESWFCSEVFQALKDADMSLCLADWPRFEVDVPDTASFVYLRRHGATGELYSGCYSETQLSKDARGIKKWQNQGKDVYIYFNNDAHGWAVKNALTLSKMLNE